MRKIILAIVFLLSLNTKIYAEHIFTDSEKEKITNNVFISISTVAYKLGISETVIKSVNKYIISDTLMHVLSRFDDKVIAQFLKYEEAELASKLGEIIATFNGNNTLTLGRKYKGVKDYFKINSTDLIFIVTDISVEFIKLEMFNNDEAKALLLDLLYNDVKAYVKLQLGDPVGATIDWGSANAIALYKSTTGIYKLAQEHQKLILSNQANEAYRIVLKIQHQYTSFIARAETNEEKSARLNGFMSTCENNDEIKYYLGAFDKKDLMYDYCSLYKEGIEQFDNNKLIYLFERMTAESGLYTEVEFNQYLEDYFPYPDIYVYKDIYHSIKYNQFNLGNDLEFIHPKDISFRHLQRAMRYGFDLVYFLPESSLKYKADTLIDKKFVVSLIYNAKQITNPNYDFSYDDILAIIGSNGEDKVTRQQLAQNLVQILELDKNLTSQQKNLIRIKANILENWSYESLILKKYKIVGNRESFYGDNLATMYEFLIMFGNSLDFLTCGHTMCSNYEIIKGLTNENK